MKSRDISYTSVMALLGGGALAVAVVSAVAASAATTSATLPSAAAASPVAASAATLVPDGSLDSRSAAPTPVSASDKVVELLEGGQPVFGIFSNAGGSRGEGAAAQGARMATNSEIDFVFYSLERGPFDIPTMTTYMRAMEGASGATGAHPLILRIPPIRDGRDAARDHVRQAIGAGVDGVVFPHVETAEEAAFAVTTMREGGDLWPLNPDGDLVNMLLIEDQAGIANAREIVSTPGVSIVAPGPGDLSRAYNRDADAVENAIQTVLAACKEFDVPCAITAGPDDIGERLEQGFRVFIVSNPAALTAGRRASGRRN